jgi:hypothetical protein
MGKQRTIEDWLSILSQFQASGLTITEFCKQHKLTLSNFYKWRKRVDGLPTSDLNPTSKPLEPMNNNWQAITLDNKPTIAKQWDIELTLPGGVVLNMRATS